MAAVVGKRERRRQRWDGGRERRRRRWRLGWRLKRRSPGAGELLLPPPTERICRPRTAVFTLRSPPPSRPMPPRHARHGERMSRRSLCGRSSWSASPEWGLVGVRESSSVGSVLEKLARWWLGGAPRRLLLFLLPPPPLRLYSMTTVAFSWPSRPCRPRRSEPPPRRLLAPAARPATRAGRVHATARSPPLPAVVPAAPARPPSAHRHRFAAARSPRSRAEMRERDKERELHCDMWVPHESSLSAGSTRHVGRNHQQNHRGR